MISVPVEAGKNTKNVVEHSGYLMKKKQFIKRNEGFVCEQCGKEVFPLVTGFCRNHCPYCLYSKHLDQNPGDRSVKCGGLMRPIQVEQEGKRGYILVHECKRCGIIKRNQLALTDPKQPDDMDRVVTIMREFAHSKTYK